MFVKRLTGLLGGDMSCNTRFFAACFVSLTLLSGLPVGELRAQEVTTTNDQSSMGVNFWFFTDYQRVWPFVDFFKTSRPFWPQPVAGSYPWSMDGTTLDLDADGYPRSLPTGVGAATLLFWGDNGYHPVGNYTVLWDGDGDVVVDQYGIGQQVSREGNKIICAVPQGPGGGNGVLLKITRTNPADPVRNIRFIAPGFEETYQTQPFHPRFLELLKPFRVLRFMDWQHANAQHVGTWEARNKPGCQTYQLGNEGVALEEMIRLCNILKADPWFCLPANGDDNYYRKFAEMVRDSLDPSLRAHVEYANEVWNGMFYGRTFVSELGGRLGFGTDWGGSVKAWSRRMVELFKIWMDVYGADYEKRIVRVAATQIGNSGVSDGLLTFENAADFCDIHAGAPYFNRQTASGSTDQLFEGLQRSVDSYKTIFANFKTQSDQYGLRMTCYEAGLDLFSVVDQVLDVRRDPRIGTLYTEYLNNWKNAGGTLMVHYTFLDDVWGLIEHMEQPVNTAHQYMAVLDFIEENPMWWTEPARLPSTSALCPARLGIAARGGSFSLTDKGISWQGAGAQPLRVITANGRVAARGTNQVKLSSAANGFYIVNAREASRSASLLLHR